MVATLTLRVYTGTNAGTESATVTGIDMISADNATNSLANRQANPISVGTKSYDKWLKLKLSTAPDNGVTNFFDDGFRPPAFHRGALAHVESPTA